MQTRSDDAARLVEILNRVPGVKGDSKLTWILSQLDPVTRDEAEQIISRAAPDGYFVIGQS
jgi:hypothetical protein